MPLYEYRCEKCGSKFEVLQKYSDAPLTTHEDCGGAVEKLISVSGLHFKGSGFYITDYSRGSAPASAAGKSESSSKSESSESKASESKSSESKPSESKSGESGSAKPDSSSTPAPATSSTPATPSKSD
jgi:putative FmdB family regulatory protein